MAHGGHFSVKADDLSGYPISRLKHQWSNGLKSTGNATCVI
ncbi:MAG: hypothetical protein ACTS73_01170 [Arsenophonus sp. NEOnobi-MAG3]